MRPWLSLLVFSITLLPPAFGQIKLPPEVRAEVGRLATLVIQHDGDDVKWIVSDEVDLFREYDPDTKTIRLRFIAYNSGKFNFYAISCKGGKLSEFQKTSLLVGNPPPPPPPLPNDPLLDVLKRLYETDAGGSKLEEVKALAKVYHSGVELLPSVTTAGDLHAKLLTARKAVLPDTALPGVRQALADELKKILPTDADVVLDYPTKAKAKDLMGRIAICLEALK